MVCFQLYPWVVIPKQHFIKWLVGWKVTPCFASFTSRSEEGIFGGWLGMNLFSCEIVWTFREWKGRGTFSFLFFPPSCYSCGYLPDEEIWSCFCHSAVKQWKHLDKSSPCPRSQDLNLERGQNWAEVAWERTFSGLCITTSIHMGCSCKPENI